MLVFGASSGVTSFSIETRFLGTLHDEISMALVYAAADVFVSPSTEENLANTVLESLSSGTPVGAFKIGGMPDMIVHKINGYLASAFDTSDLAGALFWVLNDKQRWNSLSTEARNTVVRSFSLRDSSSRYLSLYKEMLGAANRGPERGVVRLLRLRHSRHSSSSLSVRHKRSTKAFSPPTMQMRTPCLRTRFAAVGRPITA